MRYTISGKTLEITVDTLGAELVSVRHSGVERLWQNGNGSWAWHAPILFPVCGNCAVTVCGKSYDMPPHGFAKTSEFALVAHGPNFLRLSLSSTADTRRIYPYEFIFVVEYRINGNELEISYDVESLGAPVCFACGGHESFVVDALEHCKLVFPAPTRLIHSMHDRNGRLTGETVDFGTSAEFDSLAEYLRNDETLIFGGIGASEIELVERGKRRARISFEGFPNLLLWRPADSRMVCIEPWTALPDDATTEPRELSQKRGILTARSDRPVRLTRSIEWF